MADRKEQLPTSPLLARLASRLTDPSAKRSLRRRDFVVLVPVITGGTEPHLLYEKRAEGIRQGGEICFPGGRVEESDASLEAAALRETAEEVGVAPGGIEILGRMERFITHSGGVIEIVVGTIAAETVEEAVMNPHEVERSLQIPLSELLRRPAERYSLRVEVQPEYRDEAGRRHVLFPAKELGLPSRYWKPWAAEPHEVFAYRFDGETIWGITAEITRRFLELCR